MPKITVSKTPLADAARGRASVPNPYADLVQSFDDGKTRTVKCDATEKPVTEVGRLRAAAKDLVPSRGVRAIIDEPNNSFDFKLIDFTPRVRKPKTKVTEPAPE